jgi:hypothetical protein
MKHRLGRTGVVAGLIAITVFLPLLAPVPHRIDDEHFKLIQPGMTEAEVEAIFGVPAGSYDWAVQDDSILYMMVIVDEFSQNNIPGKINLQGGALFSYPPSNSKAWIGRRGAVHVMFDEHGHVVTTGAWGSTRVEPPWVRWWRKIARK